MILQLNFIIQSYDTIISLFFRFNDQIVNYFKLYKQSWNVSTYEVRSWYNSISYFDILIFFMKFL
jgi:hypothetical protein